MWIINKFSFINYALLNIKGFKIVKQYVLSQQSQAIL